MIQTIGNWREIEQAAAEKQAAKRKHNYSIREGSLLDIMGFWLKGLIIATALCVVIGAAGNMIEMIARL